MKIYVVGIGPGKEEYMTHEASRVLDESDTIIGYKVYIDLVRDRYSDKELLTTGMRDEVRRCELCIEKAAEGKTVSLICSGDAGVYGMASLMLSVAKDHPKIGVEVVPGVTAALSGSALLGAPVGHDFCVISLSDLLTPRELIEKRLRCAAEADFVMVIYNPSSKGRPEHLRKALDIIREYTGGERICGIARNIGREDESCGIYTLDELRSVSTDMFTTVFIGNSQSREVNGRFVTPRGYGGYEG